MLVFSLSLMCEVMRSAFVVLVTTHTMEADYITESGQRCADADILASVSADFASASAEISGQANTDLKWVRW